MFQVFTAMAFILFADENVDIAVIEVNYLLNFVQQILDTNLISDDSSDCTVVTSSPKRILS